MNSFAWMLIGALVFAAFGYGSLAASITYGIGGACIAGVLAARFN